MTTLTEERAIAVLKDWLSFARYTSRSLTSLPEVAGIERKQFARMSSVKRKEVPTPDELTRISKASGFPLHDLAVEAAHLLYDAPAGELEVEAHHAGTEVTSIESLKAWIKTARRLRPAGKLSQGQLAARIGRSLGTVFGWEMSGNNRAPRQADIEAIAEACGVPLPPIALQPSTSSVECTLSPPSTLDEEILQAGLLMSRRAHVDSLAQRNAKIFRARYGGLGDAESTLQAIGTSYGITRERVRQIVDKQLTFIGTFTPRTACFDALAEACKSLNQLSRTAAEVALRPLLGGDLSLQGAMDYGREVLGKALPINIVQVRNGEEFVVAGDLPTWFAQSITLGKALIGHSGAAHLTLAWALTMRQHLAWIDPDEFRQIITYSPGFEWIDENEAWYWFGSEGSANRLIKRTIEILSLSPKALDVEIIYGGLVRYARGRYSEVSEHAGIFPPMEIFCQLLAKSPDLICQQGDDFRLAEPHTGSTEKYGVAETVVTALVAMGGLASRSELFETLVTQGEMNHISLSVALAKSPLLRQLDRSVYAIRGWPISASRMVEAQQNVGNQGSKSNFKEIDLTSTGDVSWVSTLTKSSITNLYAGVPARARSHLQEGEYEGDGVESLIMYSSRMKGLVGLVRSAGGVEGSIFRVTANSKNRTIAVEILGQEDLDEYDQE